MRVIDFRLRPPLGSFLDMWMYARIDRSAQMAAGLGMTLSPSALQKSVDLMFQEMDECNIRIGVVPGRVAPTIGGIKNDELAGIVSKYPDRLVGYAAIDPSNRRAATAEIDAAVAKGMRGVVIEPGFLADPMYLGDARIYPLYAHCEDRNIPVLVMGGGNAGPDCTYTSPEHIDRVARDFPNLKLISGHGNWPWAAQIIHVCYRRPNIYLSPDMYLYNGMPGSQDYISAANGFLSERFLFASAYPLMPLKQTIDTFLSFKLKPEVIDRLMYKNAADLLGITD